MDTELACKIFGGGAFVPSKNLEDFKLKLKPLNKFNSPSDQAFESQSKELIKKLYIPPLLTLVDDLKTWITTVRPTLIPICMLAFGKKCNNRLGACKKLVKH